MRRSTTTTTEGRGTRCVGVGLLSGQTGGSPNALRACSNTMSETMLCGHRRQKLIAKPLYSASGPVLVARAHGGKTRHEPQRASERSEGTDDDDAPSFLRRIAAQWNELRYSPTLSVIMRTCSNANRGTGSRSVACWKDDRQERLRAHLEHVDGVARRRTAEPCDAARDQVRRQALLERVWEISLEAATHAHTGASARALALRRGYSGNAHMFRVVVAPELAARQDPRAERRRPDSLVHALDPVGRVDLVRVLAERARRRRGLHADFELCAVRVLCVFVGN